MGRLKRKKSYNKTKKRSNKSTVAVKDNNAIVNTLEKVSHVTEKDKQFLSIKNVIMAKWRKSYIRNFFIFFKESRLELKSVIWPSKKQTIGSTLVVFFIVGLLALFLGVLDIGLSSVIRVILR